MSENSILDVTAGSGEAYEAAIDRAVQTLASGRLVVLPTDTVYGVAADAFSPAAVEQLLSAKGRGRDHPAPVLVGERSVLHGLVTVAPAAAVALTERFWPGALTVIVPQSPSLAWDLGDSGGTVAIRMPDSPVALDLLRRSGPLAVSSANLHGQPPAPSGRAAADQLGDAVSVYLDAGELKGAVPSTIVDCTVVPPRVVRQGGLSLASLRQVVPDIA